MVEDKDKNKNPPTRGFTLPSACLLQEKGDHQYFKNLSVAIHGKTPTFFLPF